MEIVKGVVVEYKEGKVVLSAEVGALLLPELDKVKAKVESGELDLVPHTDLDKVVMVKAIEALKAMLV